MSKLHTDPFEHWESEPEHFWDTPTWPQIIGTLVVIGLGIAGVMAVV